MPVLWRVAAWQVQRHERALRVVITGPAASPDASPADLQVATWNAGGEPVAATVDWRLLADDGRELVAARVASRGAVRLQVPALRESAARLEVSAHGVGDRASATIDLKHAASTALYHIATDKPAYRPGDAVRWRVVGLDRARLTALDGRIRVRITDPKGAAVNAAVLQTDDGVVAEAWQTPDDLAGDSRDESADLLYWHAMLTTDGDELDVPIVVECRDFRGQGVIPRRGHGRFLDAGHPPRRGRGRQRQDVVPRQDDAG